MHVALLIRCVVKIACCDLAIAISIVFAREAAGMLDKSLANEKTNAG